MTKRTDERLERPLVQAAAALDEELEDLEDHARRGGQEALDTDKSLARATKALGDSVQLHARIEERLKGLVAEIDRARQRQQDSIETLVKVAQALEVRVKSRDALLQRFATLGAAGSDVNERVLELSRRRKESAPDPEQRERLAEIQSKMDAVIEAAGAIAESAAAEGWPEIQRQASGVRQQMQSARNKIALQAARVS